MSNTAKQKDLIPSDSQVKTTAAEVTPIVPVKESSSIESLISKAIEHNVSVETLERLLSMREKLKAEQAREMYFTSLAAFQGECPVIKKNKAVKNKDGRSTRYSYATAEQIEKQTAGLRARHGFSHTLISDYKEGVMNVTCVIQHIGGHTERSPFGVPIDTEAYMNEPQKVASARTFAARYAILNGYGIVTGDVDDDGLALGEPVAPTPPAVSEEVCNDVHDKTLLFLESSDADGMKGLWKQYDADQQNYLWKMFNSAQRSRIKQLIKGK